MKIILTGSLMFGISTFLTGCNRDSSSVVKDIKSCCLNDKAGIIKNGDELIPFYYDKFDGFVNCYCYYFLENGEYIGYNKSNDFANVILKNNNVLYAVDTQTIYFGENYPNVYCNYDVISEYDERVC